MVSIILLNYRYKAVIFLINEQCRDSLERHLQNRYHQGLINRFAFPSTFYPTEFNYYLDDKRSLALLANERAYEPEQIDTEIIKHDRENDILR